MQKMDLNEALNIAYFECVNCCTPTCKKCGVTELLDECVREYGETGVETVGKIYAHSDGRNVSIRRI